MLAHVYVFESRTFNIHIYICATAVFSRSDTWFEITMYWGDIVGTLGLYESKAVVCGIDT